MKVKREIKRLRERERETGVEAKPRSEFPTTLFLLRSELFDIPTKPEKIVPFVSVCVVGFVGKWSGTVAPVKKGRDRIRRLNGPLTEAKPESKVTLMQRL